MAIPASVVLVDRGDGNPLDLTPMITDGSLTWSTVVPGGFASCSFELEGDFRPLMKILPYLNLIRVIADSGAVLWEGQIEDLSPTLSDSEVGIQVNAFGLQNMLKEGSIRRVWTKRDLTWDDTVIAPGSLIGPYTASPNMGTATGNFDATNLARSGAQFQPAGSGLSMPNNAGGFAVALLPAGVGALTKVRGLLDVSGTDSGSAKFEAVWLQCVSGAWSLITGTTTTGTAISWAQNIGSSPTAVAVGAVNASGGAVTMAANDNAAFYDMRLLGTVTDEDTPDSFSGGNIVFGGYFGSTLINSILAFFAGQGIGPGVIEQGADFLVDHLDASVRRAAYDLVQEVASYYVREWAIWENGLFDWKTPNLQQNQWVIPLNVLTGLNMDASVVNSQSTSYVLFTDAASGVDNEAFATSTDRRNPYVKKGRGKHQLSDASLTMTSNTAQQLATIILQDLGFGPVPASGTVVLPGETIVQHASANAKKAWEIRAGENVTLPELPLNDIFTQDGRGEVLFHVVSTEADSSEGTVTLTLDSFGSKRSDVLIARLAAITQALGG